MDDEPVIRCATEADAAAISRLISDLTQRSIAPDCSPEGTTQLLESMTPAAVAERLRGEYLYCVAELAGKLVGVAAMRPPAHLYNLFVAEQMQGQGLARILWDAMREEFFTLHGTSTVTVNSARRAVAAYQKLGFIVQGPEQVHNGVPTTPMSWQPGTG